MYEIKTPITEINNSGTIRLQTGVGLESGEKPNLGVSVVVSRDFSIKSNEINTTYVKGSVDVSGGASLCFGPGCGDSWFQYKIDIKSSPSIDFDKLQDKYGAW